MMKEFSKEDLEELKSRGVNEDMIKEQMNAFDGKFSRPDVVRTASLEDGIQLYSKVDEDAYIDAWDAFIGKGKSVYHFIPASGEADRFLRELFSFLKAPYVTPRTNFEKNFFKHLQSFAFFNELNKLCIDREDKEVSDLMEIGKFKLIVEYLLTEKGLNYAEMPNALFKFHSDSSKSFMAMAKYLPKKIVKYYSSWEDTRTPIQESLIESAMVSGVKGSTVNVCYTVKVNERDAIQDFVREFKIPIEKKFGVQLYITLPVQQPSTDTISLSADGKPLRDEEGKILLRPSGHGAVFNSFNSLSADVIFVKNLDNEAPDSLKKLTVRYKRMLGGVLVNNHKTIKKYLRLLDKDEIPDDKLIEIINYVENTLNVKRENILRLKHSEQVEYLKSKLNRPLRVCGMVRNEDEQGGVPCWVKNSDGTVSLQIVEYYQAYDNPDKLKIFNGSTHFNPVDMVCYVADWKEKKFDLTKYADAKAWVPYNKVCASGDTVRRLDRPGLWNGCMADWNTIFVEVPIKTFNPVKSINDLLRQEHQN